ncbi:MAG TPA: hypothetical protein DDZ80_09610 [Cyanobacteria bacterium UBA8803]|nr:hypothetical protein [Cyanobacteria bacterium UBA9273]HBL58752.1 hypothetical protein [Cyanobacteria bacterium UBA8803]
MTGSPLKKYVITPIMFSAAVFSALTLPLAVVGQKPVTIQFQKEPVFQGQLRDAATPYLGLATVLSLGTGIATIAMTGWQQSSRKSQKTEEQLSELEQNLKEKEKLLETLQLPESQGEIFEVSILVEEALKELAAENAPTAVEEDIEVANSQSAIPNPPSPIPAEPVKETSVTPQIELPVAQPMIFRTQPLEAQPMIPRQVTVQAAATKFAAAQNFLAYNKAKTSSKQSLKVTSPTSSEAEQLQHQLETMMAQMQALQTALQATPLTPQSEGKIAEPTNSAPLKVVKSWAIHPVAS